MSGSLVRGTRDLNPAASRRFPMVLDDIAGATCAQISSLEAVRLDTAARTMRLVCKYGNVLQTTVESSDTLFLTSAAIHRYVHPASRRPTKRPR